MKGQTRFMSLVEAWANIIVGFGVSFLGSAIILPLFGMHPTLQDIGWITAAFTGLSLIRSYTMRRIFERWR